MEKHHISYDICSDDICSDVAGFVVEIVKIVNCSTDVLKTALSKIDTLKSDQIENQKHMLALKDEKKIILFRKFRRSAIRKLKHSAT